MGLDRAFSEETSLNHDQAGLNLEPTRGGERETGKPGEGLWRHKSRKQHNSGRKQRRLANTVPGAGESS